MQEPAAAAVREALTQVFARPEFQERPLPGLLQALADLRAAVLSWIGDILRRAFGALGGLDPLPARVVIAVLLLVAVLAAVYLLVRGFRPGSAGAPREREKAAVQAPSGPSEWAARARHAQEEGRFREAALALYRAVVLHLEVQGAVRFHQAKTPGDYRREVRATPEARPLFDRFVRLLLPLAFGAEVPQAGMFDELRRAAARIGIDA